MTGRNRKDVVAMPHCVSCGAELEPGSTLCAKCGAPVQSVSEAQAGQKTLEIPTGISTPTSAGPPASSPPKAAGSGHKALITALAAVAALGIAVALVLGFAVGPKWFVSKGGENAHSVSGGGGSEEAGPEQVVRAFYEAMQKGDASAILALVEDGNRKRLDEYARANGFSDGEALLAEFINTVFPLKDLVMTDLEMETSINGDTATVRITSGKATYTGPGGKRVEEGCSDGGDVFGDAGFDLVRKDGRWYIALELGGGSQSNERSGEGQSGEGQSEGGQSEEGSDTEKSGPEKVVDDYFRATQQKDAKLLLSTFSSSSIAMLESQLSEAGYSDLETFVNELLFSSYQSIDFQGIKYQTVIDGDKAVVKVLEGKAIIIDEDGNTIIEDVLDAGVPVDIPLVREGGKWYIDLLQ